MAKKTKLQNVENESEEEYDCNDVPFISPPLTPRVLLLQMIDVFRKTKKAYVIRSKTRNKGLRIH